MADAFADKRPARFLENGVVPLADVRNMLGRRERAVGKLHQAALAFADDPAQAGDFTQAREPARDRFAVFAIMTLVGVDRKSTRLNSSHSQISYAVFCL